MKPLPELVAKMRGNYMLTTEELRFIVASQAPGAADEASQILARRISITPEDFAKSLRASDTAMYNPAPSSKQVGGDHYSKLGAYQPWQVLAEWLTPEELRGFMKGTVIAYLAREKDKGGDVDISKSLHTMELFQQFRKDK